MPTHPQDAFCCFCKISYVEFLAGPIYQEQEDLCLPERANHVWVEYSFAVEKTVMLMQEETKRLRIRYAVSLGFNLLAVWIVILLYLYFSR